MGDEGEEIDGYRIIKEGEAEILFPSSNSVFYNKTQVPVYDSLGFFLLAFVDLFSYFYDFVYFFGGESTFF